MGKVLKKSSNKVISGVAAGFAEYLDVDPTLVRVVLVVSAFVSGLGVIAYIAGLFLMEDK